MNPFSFRKILSLAVISTFACFSAAGAFGQAVKVTGDKPSFDTLPSPEFSGGKQKGFRPKDWLEMEVKLRVLMQPEPKSKTCDKLTVKWYIALKNPEKAGTYLLVTKDVEHVNIPLDDDIYCSVYISPASMKRLTGTDRVSKTVIEYVGYEVLVNGQKVAEETNHGKAGWWNVASDKISRTDTVPLLNKSETPFRDMWWDRYAEVSAPNK
jgi:hypothetical protein